MVRAVGPEVPDAIVQRFSMLSRRRYRDLQNGLPSTLATRNFSTGAVLAAEDMRRTATYPRGTERTVPYHPPGCPDAFTKSRELESELVYGGFEAGG
jgi:hypothetical protein